MAHETVDRVADSASHAEQEVRDVAARTAKKAKQAQEHALEVAEDSVEKVKSYVEQNPLASAGIAFAAGLILSSLIRR